MPENTAKFDMDECVTERKLRWSEETQSMQCAQCGGVVDRMTIEGCISLGLSGDYADEDREEYYVEGWNYTNIRLECPCGVVIKADDLDGFDCADFIL